MNRFISLAKFLFIFTLVLVIHSQIVPETVRLTHLPNQTQDFYHGWLRTSNQPESYLYYQLFSADGTTFDDPDQSQTPLLVYLEGGPGQSSVFIGWSGFGPYGVDSDMNFTDHNTPEDLEFTLYKRELSWTRFSHILLIDSPIQTGYSFSAPEEFLNTTADVVDQLVVFMKRFYEIYPRLLDNSLYIVGNCYGGHFATYLPYILIRDHNLTLVENRKIKLAGVTLIAPLIDAKFQADTTISDYLFAAGVTDPHSKQVIRENELQIQELIQSGQLLNATHLFYNKEVPLGLNNLPGEPFTSHFAVHNTRLNRALQCFPLEALRYFVPSQTFFNISIPTVKSARDLLNIPSFLKFYMMGYATPKFQAGYDHMLQLSYTMEFLLNQDIIITLFAAQDDNSFPAAGLVKLVSSLNWKGAKEFKQARRKIFKSKQDDNLASLKQYQNLNLVTVFDSGHYLLDDQPGVVFDILSMLL